MKAKLILKDKYIYQDGFVLELVIWKLPRPDKFRPHGIKYRLFYGIPGRCKVRYDNEKGKGDCRHIENREEPHHFESVGKLVHDFKTDVQKLRGDKNE